MTETTAAVEPLKEADMLPLQRRTFVATITKRKKKATGDSVADERRPEVGQGGGDDSDEEDGDGMEESYDVSLSSEEPVDRWFGREILLHDKKNINLERADPESGLPLLAGHDDRSLPIGRIRNLRAEDGKLKGTLTPSKTPRGQEAKTLIDEGHREMSLGYEINEFECTPGKAGAPDEYRATKWTPMEGSLVSVPADHTVGVGRSKTGKLFPVSVRNARSERQPEVRSMETAQEVAAARAAASKDSAEILRRATLHGVPTERALKWIEDGVTLASVNEQILEFRATKPTTQPAAETLQLSEAEARQYSYSRAILAAATMAEGNRMEKCFELDISQELDRTMPAKYQRRGGLFIPTTLRGTKWAQENVRDKKLSDKQVEQLQRAIRTGTIDSQTATAIKEVVFTEYGGELIEILRNMAKTVAMGARVLTGLSSPIAFPRQDGDPTAFWVAENPGTDVTGSNPNTDLVVLTPRTLQAATAYSRQLLVQSSVDVEAMVRSSIAAKHALAVDLAAIHGTGSNSQPLGIYNTPNVQTIDYSNAAYSNSGQKIAFTGAVAMQGKLATANALRGALGYLTAPLIAVDALTTLRFPNAAIAQGGQLWNGNVDEGEMAGYRAETTNQVSSTLGANGASSGGSFVGLIFGNWEEVIIGQFGGAMEMIVDPYTKKKQGLIEVASFQMADVAIRHPVSFCVGTNLNS